MGVFFLQRMNMLINENVITTSYEAGVKKVVSALSTAIFPAKATYPVDETIVSTSYIYLFRPPGTTVPDGLMFYRRCFFSFF